MPFFSIIVPVYNSSLFLLDCLESIQKQTFEDFEVILVDDGSTDDSQSICRNFSNADARFKYIYQENKGTSSARNTGLAFATGLYITFIDNDDLWIRNDALASLKAIIDETKADIIVHESFEFHDQNAISTPIAKEEMAKQINNMTRNEALCKLLEHQLLAYAVWSKVYSADIVFSEESSKPILFPVGRRNEDTFWTGEIIRKAKRIAFCPVPFYAYRKGTDYAQTSKPLTLNQLDDLSWTCLNYINEISLDTKEEDKESLLSYICYPFVVWMGQSGTFKKANLNQKLYQQMKINKWVLKYGKDRISKAVFYLCQIIGFEPTRIALSIAFKQKNRYLSKRR